MLRASLNQQDLPIDFGDRVERLGGVVHLARDAPFAAALGHRLLRQSVELLLAAAAAAAAATSHSVPYPLVTRGRGETGRVPEGNSTQININLIHRTYGHLQDLASSSPT